MEKISVFENAMIQLRRAVANLKSQKSNIKGIKEKILRLENPEKIIEVNFPVRMDNGSTKVFQGYRVQYSSSLGPCKGGIRFHPDVNPDEVKALAFWMSVKCSLAGLPLGGGKGGVIVDPKKLSPGELERLSRGYVKALWHDLGPYVDVPGPDMNITPQIMAWMVDEYSKQFQKLKIKDQNHRLKLKNLTKGEVSATFTGKPINRGGSKGRSEATARGGLYILQDLLRRLKKDRPSEKDDPSHTSHKTIAVQGMGNAGGIFALLAQEAGFKIVALSDSKGGVYNPEGLDVKMARIWKEQKGTVSDFPGPGRQRPITNNELLELPVDVLLLAAFENILNGSNAPKIKARLILELANGPTSSLADKILNRRKIMVVPDFLANSGGVIVSYFEWFQNLRNQHWTEKQVNLKLKEYMEKAFAKVWRVHINQKVDLRNAAYLVALERILNSMK